MTVCNAQISGSREPYLELFGKTEEGSEVDMIVHVRGLITRDKSPIEYVLYQQLSMYH